MPDWTTVITSVLASSVLSSVVTAIVAPSINWGIEKKKLTRTYRESQIRKWREMISQIISQLDNVEQRTPGNIEVPTPLLLERHPDFYSLKPLLSQTANAEIYRTRTVNLGSTIPSALYGLIDEIARIEKEWGLS